MKLFLKLYVSVNWIIWKQICADKVDKVKYFIVIYIYYTTDKMNYLHKYNVNLSLLKKY